MRFSRTLSFAVPFLSLAAVLVPLSEARACGGCFHVPGESTQVTSHRMVLSVSQQQSTLYDEIHYAGSPSSFAWILPIRGPVTVGLSSDALFNEIDLLTAVTVNAPNLPCPPCGPVGGGATGSATGSGGGFDAGSVTVISQGVIGPYSQVQVSSSDPTALTTWLTMNGYAVPTDVAPIIAAYVNEGFDFLALKLVGGASVSAMRPVSVTTPGASPVLPLRMVAAGTGVTVTINLFVVGEGRYEPENFPWFTIDPAELVWDFSTESSNYKTIRQQGFTSTPDQWLVESALPISAYTITSDITASATITPLMSGYADSMGNGAPAAAQADLDTLFAGIDTTSMWVTRLLAEMPRASLTSDLTLGASTSQAQLPTSLTAPKYVNAPPCPCGATVGAGGGATSSGSSIGTGGSGAGAGGEGGAGTGGSGVQGCGSCAVGEMESSPFALCGSLAALAVMARRQRRTGARWRTLI